MNQKKTAIITIISGVALILFDAFVLPLILVLTGAVGVVGGSAGIIGGAGLPTLLFLLREARRGILPVLSFVGILCIAVGVIVLILNRIYNKRK